MPPWWGTSQCYSNDHDSLCVTAAGHASLCDATGERRKSWQTVVMSVRCDVRACHCCDDRVVAEGQPSKDKSSIR